jgi:hypothetical protein
MNEWKEEKRGCLNSKMQHSKQNSGHKKGIITKDIFPSLFSLLRLLNPETSAPTAPV